MQLVSSAIDQSHDCVFVIDPGTLQFEYVNCGAVEKYGYSGDEFRRMTPLRLSTEHDESQVRALMAPLLRGETKSLRFETVHRTKQGFNVPVEVSLQLAAGKESQRRLVAIVRDISDRKEIQQSLLAAKEEADRTTQSKSEFLANLSHELRTPLSGVIGMMELLENTALMEHQRHLVQLCRSSGEHLLQLINNVLDLSKIEAAKLDLDLQEFGLEQLVVDTVEATARGNSAKQLSVRHEVDESARIVLKGDRCRLRQVLINLLGNAIKFTAAGEVIVRAQTVARCRDVVTIRFSVSDTGIGIPPEKLDRLFQPYSQADASVSRSFGGTGLGLAIARNTVELMGGTIGVESTPAMGSTFWFQIPFDAAPGGLQLGASDSLHLRSVAPGGVQGTRDGARLSGHALLAEDDNVNRLYMVQVLKHLGMTVDIVTNGREVMDAVQRQSYDVVLMDCQMPELDGFSAARCIRELESSGLLDGHLPIVALTANALEGDRQRCLDAGMDDYLSKPAQINRIAGMLSRFLRASTGTASRRHPEAPLVPRR